MITLRIVKVEWFWHGSTDFTIETSILLCVLCVWPDCGVLWGWLLFAELLFALSLLMLHGSHCGHHLPHTPQPPNLHGTGKGSSSTQTTLHWLYHYEEAIEEDGSGEHHKNEEPVGIKILLLWKQASKHNVIMFTSLAGVQFNSELLDFSPALNNPIMQFQPQSESNPIWPPLQIKTTSPSSGGSPYCIYL